VSHIRVDVALPAPPAAVWADVGHIARHVEWMADAVSIRFVGERRDGVGTTFDCRTRIGPLRVTDRMVVTEWEPPSVMGISHQGAVTGTGRFTLRAEGTGTRFTWEEDLRFPWWLGGRLGGLVGAPVLAMVWRRNLAALRRRFA